MFVLTIKSLRTPDSLRIKLVPSKTIRMGRGSRATLPVPWDQAISREHADITLHEETLEFACLPNARNPAVFDGKPVREMTFQEGDEFRVGSTSFLFEREAPPAKTVGSGSIPHRIDTGSSFINFDAVDDDDEESNLMERHSYGPGELKKYSFDRADERIELLTQLPRLIAQSVSDEDLAFSLAGFLLRAIPKATAVAVARFPLDELPSEDDNMAAFPRPSMLRIETRDTFDGTFRPSRRLIQRALKTHESVIQIWHGSAGSANFTLSDGLGWAIVIPISGQSCEGWCLYISGAGSEGTMIVTKELLVGDLRYAELIAQFIGSIRQVRLLESQKTRMSAFFSPKIVDSLTKATSKSTLNPIEREVAVLFCDVRNFSAKSEELKDELLQLLKSVSTALGTMTDGILDFDGTIADFQGDAALGFWGWPVENPEGPIPACRAALQILEGFSRPSEDRKQLLDGFSIGMGIAYGRALAGEIGTERQSKLGVFGPVVNSGARLQGLSKKFGVPICIDEPTAQFVRDNIPPKVAITRKLGRVIPRGMILPMNVYSLEPVSHYVPGDDEDRVRQSFEFAVDALQSGNWSEASRIVSTLPDTDGPTRFLKSFFEEQGETPPANWSGSIEFHSK